MYIVGGHQNTTKCNLSWWPEEKYSKLTYWIMHYNKIGSDELAADRHFNTNMFNDKN